MTSSERQSGAIGPSSALVSYRRLSRDDELSAVMVVNTAIGAFIERGRFQGSSLCSLTQRETDLAEETAPVIVNQKQK